MRLDLKIGLCDRLTAAAEKADEETQALLFEAAQAIYDLADIGLVDLQSAASGHVVRCVPTPFAIGDAKLEDGKVLSSQIGEAFMDKETYLKSEERMQERLAEMIKGEQEVDDGA